MIQSRWDWETVCGATPEKATGTGQIYFCVNRRNLRIEVCAGGGGAGAGAAPLNKHCRLNKFFSAWPLLCG
jgi:hypothetical protein